MISTKRISRIEERAAPQIKRTVIDLEKQALEEWRHQNQVRISWDLFTLLESPKLDPQNYVKDAEYPESDGFIDSHRAYFAMAERVMKHGYDDEGFLNTSKMTAEEGAFAVCFQKLYDEINEARNEEQLLWRGIWDQAVALGLGRALYEHKISVADAVRSIDEHRGGPEWRQIWDNNSDQEALDAKLGIPSIKEIPPRGRAWVDLGQV